METCHVCEEGYPSHTSDALMTPATSIVPFLKWAGGKRWLAASIAPVTLKPESTYFEPFVGSGAMYFSSTPQKAVLSDANSELIEAFSVIKDFPEAVFSVLKTHSTKHSTDYYYQVRATRCRTPVTRAARFIYLNRTCWNGLYRVNKSGEFNVPKGTKTSVILESDDFFLISEILKNAELICSDFEAQIDRAKDGDFIFADPPYTVRHKHNGFIKYNENLFSWEDQERLCAALWRAKGRGASVLVTNADHYSIRALYADFDIEETSRYSAISGAAKKRGRFDELLIR